MSKLFVLSLTIGVLAAIWTFLALGPLAGYVLIWAAFISWACFFAVGGDDKALAKTIAGNIWGAFLAWVALTIIVNVPVPALGNAWPALVVGATVFVLVIAATVDLLSAVPAGVLGYATTAGYTLTQPGVTDKLMTAEIGHPFIIVVISMVIGALLGWLSAKISAALSPQAAAA
jgi:hypothetical protein